MGVHSQYGKKVMKAAVGSQFTDWGTWVEVDYGCGDPARIDGVVGSDVAVEIDSRVGKQVRGAVLDLICHQSSKKLLIVEPVQMTDPEVCAEQCRNILRRFLRPSDFRVVVLAGSGQSTCLDADAAAVREALSELRKQPVPTA